MTLRKSSTYRADALVLRRRDLGEADRTITLYSREHGKRRGVAKAVRRPQSRLAGHLELFTHVEVFVVVGSNLDIITQARALETFPAIAADLSRFARASWAAEIVDRLTPDAEPDAELFDLLLQTIKLLARGRNGGVHLRHFELLALDRLGYQAQLESCVACGGPLQERDNRFAAPAGGVVCQRCAPAHDGVSISVPALKVMRWLAAKPIGAASRLRSSPALEAELEMIHKAYLGAILEGALRSAELLDRIRSTAGRGAPVA